MTVSNAELIMRAERARDLMAAAPDKYGPDSFGEECQCDVCEFMRAATPEAVLALVTVGQRDCDKPRSPEAERD